MFLARLSTRLARVVAAVLFVATALLPAQSVAANSPPDPPVITSPETGNVNPEDVHMEMGAPFNDPDGDEHVATDWEIRTGDGQTVVWAAYNSAELTHAHFDTGVFQGPLAGKRALAFVSRYLFRVRYQDSRGAWSAWAERPFTTMRLDRMLAQQIRGVLMRPAPTWLSDGGAAMSLPAGARLLLETPEGEALLTLTDDAGLLATPGPLLAQPAVIRLRLVGPAEASLRLPSSRLTLVSDHAQRLTFYLPTLLLPAGGQQVLWISETGATFFGTPEQPRFNREVYARDMTLPWQLPPGYQLEAVSGAFHLPTSLAFVPNPSSDPAAPRFYVTELHRGVKVVTNDGRVFTFADSLLNFRSNDDFPGGGEQGVVGVCLPPGGGAVYVTLVRRDAQGIARIKITRFATRDGLTIDAVDDILAAGEEDGRARPSHQIQQCLFGPDGKLYTFVADGTGPRQAASDATYNGKVLRLNPDGTAPTDNPRYDPANPTAPISYQYTKGQRNAYGLAFRAADGRLYLTENGPNVDRLVRVTPGLDYGWDGTDESMRLNASYVWPDAHWAPVGLAFVEGPAASALPADLQGALLVASASPAFTTGPQRQGKAIQVFRLDAEGQPTAPPALFGRYIGEGRGTIVDLKLQPDGLYFTELFFDGGDGGPIAPGGRVWRIRYTGDADFAASETSGPAPLTVAFTDRSTRLGANRWQWAFGDGEQSEEQSPRHTFARPGRYAVRLLVTGADGQPAERLQLVTVTEASGAVPAPAIAPAPLLSPPTPAVIAFPEMGTVLGGGFKHFWERHGGLGQFGYPLTQELREVNPSDGREYTVQYFERARFEYHPEYAGTPYETQLGLVGRQAIAGREAEPPFQPVAGPGDDDARYFDVTGHTLRGIFRERWETTGGVDLYGLPISEVFEEQSYSDGDAYLVQYFERARMEYHPDVAGTFDEVRLRRIGTQVFVRRPAPRLRG